MQTLCISIWFSSKSRWCFVSERNWTWRPLHYEMSCCSGCQPLPNLHGMFWPANRSSLSWSRTIGGEITYRKFQGGVLMEHTLIAFCQLFHSHIHVQVIQFLLRCSCFFSRGRKASPAQTWASKPRLGHPIAAKRRGSLVRGEARFGEEKWNKKGIKK